MRAAARAWTAPTALRALREHGRYLLSRGFALGLEQPITDFAIASIRFQLGLLAPLQLGL